MRDKKLTYRELEEELSKVKKELEIQHQSETIEKLKETLFLLKSILGSMKDIIILSIDKDYKYLYFNDFHKSVMKSIYKIDVEIGMNILDCISIKEDYNKAKANYDKALAGNSHSMIEAYGNKTKSYFESFFNPVFNEKNEIVGATAFARNITDRKQIEQSLQESNNRYKALFQNLSSSLSLYEVLLSENGEPYDYRFLAVNSKYEKTVGIKSSELIGKTLLEVFPGTEDVWLRQIKETYLTGITSTTENYACEVDRYVELTVYVPQKGQVAFISPDIDERKKAELEIIENQILLKNQNEELQKAKEKAEESERNLKSKNEDYIAINEELKEKNNEYLSLNEEFKTQNEELLAAKEKAEENEKKFRSLYDNINVGVALHEIVLDSEGKPIDFIFLDVNPTYERITTLKKKNIVGKLGRDVIPNLEQKWIDLYGEVALTGKPVSIIDHSDFLNKYWDIKAYAPAKNQFATAMTDITERILAENQLKVSEEKYKSLIHSSPLGMYIYHLDKDNRLLFEGFNPSADRMLGISHDKLIGRTIEEAFPNLIQTEIPEMYKKIARGELSHQTFEIPYQDERFSGFYKVDVFSHQCNSIAVHFIDISDLKNAEIEINNKNEFVSNIINSISDAFFSMDNNLVVNYFNPAAEKMLGRKAEDILGKYLFDSFPEAKGSIFDVNYHKALNEKRSIAFETYFEVPPYKNWYDVNVYPQTNGISVFFQITTERKMYELELQKAKEKAEESDRLKTEFISNMSHEIRTPMNGILGFSTFLAEENLTTEKRKHYVSIIQNSGHQLMRIIDDILEISKLETKQVIAIENEICLNDKLLELFSIFDIKAKENKTPLYLKKGLSDKDSCIFTDETKLNKILSNLIENALKFTNNGFIEFGYNIIQTGDALSQQQIELYVKDTGIGINSDKQEIIFERFSQEEKEISKNVGGLGLGLSIAKENTELLGGQITLKSEKGKGSTFFVTIPYKPVNLTTNKNNILEKHNEYTILIVEDEEVNYLYLETLFENEKDLNCKILHAKNGEEAVEMCKFNSKIDLVLMDLKMPIMNGFEATKIIKNLRPDLSIVAQTAYTTAADKEKALSAGCDDFISKPLSKVILNEMTNKYLVDK